MENASKALIMAAEVLFGIMLISLGVVVFSAWQSFSEEISDNIEIKNIQEFNTKITAYDGRTDLTPHDVISILNYIKEYNDSVDDGSSTSTDDDYYKIQITGTANISINSVLNDIAGFINNNYNKTFSLTVSEYNSSTNLVKKITINKNKQK